MLRRRRATEPVISDILVVCTGNICRSPFIATLLGSRHPSLTVRSAGTGALVGSPPPAPILELLAQRGIVSVNHAGAQLTPALVAGATLLICATAEHRSRAIAMDAAAADRSFTLLELARLVAPARPSGGLAGLLAAGQGALTAAALIDHDDDLNDPFQRPQAAYDAMAASVDAALAVLDPWIS